MIVRSRHFGERTMIFGEIYPLRRAISHNAMVFTHGRPQNPSDRPGIIPVDLLLDGTGEYAVTHRIYVNEHALAEQLVLPAYLDPQLNAIATALADSERSRARRMRA